MIVGHVTNRTMALSVRPRRLSWFAVLDARAKILGVFCFVVVSAMLTNLDMIVLALGIAIALIPIAMVDARAVGKAYLAASPFIVLSSVSVFLFAGLESGIAMLARTSACVLPLLVVVVGTDPFDIFSGLRRLKVPWVVTTLLMLTHRYLLLFSEELSRMKVARRARGFTGGRSILDRYGLRVTASTAAAVLLRAWMRADRVFEGLKARGFDKDMTAWRNSKFGAPEAVFTLALLIVSVAILAVQLEVVS